MNRLESLLNMLKESPEDPFLIYGLALEYHKTNLQKAKGYFDQLLNEHPDYVATYYHAGSLYEELDDEDTAKTIYAKGMEVSKAAGDQHAYGELKTVFDMLDF
ncbi:MAG: tetratricopeptide repeat protein [Cyclobacteriaceae bacterium]